MKTTYRNYELVIGKNGLPIGFSKKKTNTLEKLIKSDISIDEYVRAVKQEVSEGVAIFTLINPKFRNTGSK